MFCPTASRSGLIPESEFGPRLEKSLSRAEFMIAGAGVKSTETLNVPSGSRRSAVQPVCVATPSRPVMSHRWSPSESRREIRAARRSMAAIAPAFKRICKLHTEIARAAQDQRDTAGQANPREMGCTPSAVGSSGVMSVTGP